MQTMKGKSFVSDVFEWAVMEAPTEADLGVELLHGFLSCWVPGSAQAS